MRQSNFLRLVSCIRKESIQRAIDNSPAVSVSRFKKSHATHKSFMAKAINSARSLNKALVPPKPTKAQIKTGNQSKMRAFRKSLSAAVKDGNLTGLEACRLEAQANATSLALAAKGLI